MRLVPLRELPTEVQRDLLQAIADKEGVPVEEIVVPPDTLIEAETIH